uniref:Uncharacterized protein n=1 Tax=Sphaerodactylus townsendi TaxID=933632 RepID=A0ACB8FZ70_9SAUR
MSGCQYDTKILVLTSKMLWEGRGYKLQPGNPNAATQSRTTDEYSDSRTWMEKVLQVKLPNSVQYADDIFLVLMLAWNCKSEKMVQNKVPILQTGLRDLLKITTDLQTADHMTASGGGVDSFTHSC